MEDIEELEAKIAQEVADNAAMEVERAKRKEVVVNEFAFFKKIYPETDRMPPRVQSGRSISQV